MSKFKVGDKVRVVKVKVKSCEKYYSRHVGAVGIITDIKKSKSNYPMFVEFDSDLAECYWCDEELELVKEEVKVKTYGINELVEDVEYRSKGVKYRLKDGKLQVFFDSSSKYFYSNEPYNKVLDMEFTECEFEPQNGDRYFYPYFRYSNGYDSNYWSNDTFDINTKRNIGVYRTLEQAQEKARELGWIE